MDVFDDAFGAPTTNSSTEPDPAADFIQREQADLGDLGMDFGMAPAAAVPGPPSAAVPEGDGITDFFAVPGPPTGSAQEGDGTNSFFEPSTNDSSDMLNGLGTMTSSDMPDFSSSATLDSSAMPELNGSGMADNSGFGMSDISAMSTTINSDMPDFSASGATDSSNVGMPGLSTEHVGTNFAQIEMPAMGAADPMEEGGPFEISRTKLRQSGEEPDCIIKWKEEQKERIRIKDEEEDKKKEELRQTAKRELESWYKNYEDELEQIKKENRVAEEAFLADVHGLKPGTEWERVSRNCNFNSKVNHNKKDRSRLRNVLLSLKQTPLMNRE